MPSPNWSVVERKRRAGRSDGGERRSKGEGHGPPRTVLEEQQEQRMRAEPMEKEGGGGIVSVPVEHLLCLSKIGWGLLNMVVKHPAPQPSLSRGYSQSLRGNDNKLQPAVLI